MNFVIARFVKNLYYINVKLNDWLRYINKCFFNNKIRSEYY